MKFYQPLHKSIWKIATLCTWIIADVWYQWRIGGIFWTGRLRRRKPESQLPFRCVPMHELSNNKEKEITCMSLLHISFFEVSNLYSNSSIFINLSCSWFCPTATWMEIVMIIISDSFRVRVLGAISLTGGGGVWKLSFCNDKKPYVTLLGGRGYEISIFKCDILFAWPYVHTSS